MIKILDDYALGFIEFLNNKHFTDEEVSLSIMHDYVGFRTDKGQECYAMYVRKKKMIFVATKIPAHLKKFKDFIIFNLAHEYKHFLQEVNQENVSGIKAEEDANEFAKKMCQEYGDFDYSTILIRNLFEEKK